MISKLADMIAGWLKPVPHFPENGRRWLANNIWWLTLIGAILCSISLAIMTIAFIVALPTFMAMIGFYSMFGINLARIIPYVLGATISMIFLLIVVVINFMAVKPLKRMEIRGWNLLFLTEIIGIVIYFSNLFLHFDMSDLFSSLISFIIGAAFAFYVLNEIRSYFGPTGAAAVAGELMPAPNPMTSVAPNPIAATSFGTMPADPIEPATGVTATPTNVSPEVPVESVSISDSSNPTIPPSA